MSAKQTNGRKRADKNGNGNASTLDAQNKQLQRELNELREENRCLKRSLSSLMFKDLPVNMDLKPDDGVTEPSLTALIARLEHAGKP